LKCYDYGPGQEIHWSVIANPLRLDLARLYNYTAIHLTHIKHDRSARLMLRLRVLGHCEFQFVNQFYIMQNGLLDTRVLPPPFDG
jgi:hypothetical protein